MGEAIADEFDDETTARIDRALSEHQRIEREETESDLKRQAEADERVVDALSRKID